MENFMHNSVYYAHDVEKIPTLIHVNANHDNFRGSNTWTSCAEPNYTVPFVINYRRQMPLEEFRAIPTKAYLNPLMLPSKTVLVNPHFKRNVHVNPHFNKPPTTNVKTVNILSKAPTIHVNPKALEKIHTGENLKTNETDFSAKVPAASGFEPAPTVQRSKRRLSIRTKYKIVRSGTVFKSPVLKSKYKIDRRSTLVRKSTTPRIVSKRKIVHHRYVRTVSDVSSAFKTSRPISTVRRKFCYVTKCESSKLYRTFVKSPFTSDPKTVGHRYVVDRRRKYVRKSISDDKPNQTPKRKPKSILSSACRRITNSSRKLVIKRIVRPRKGTRKENTQCPYFRKYGSCRGKENGTCNKLHDEKHVTVCKKFLKGACDSKNCHLSHDVSLKKMPTCKYFLDGFCGKENCPYLHVKLNPKTEICKAFLQGYCDAADQCDKRHVSICPVFDKNGVCNERNCPHRHTVKPVENVVPDTKKSKPEIESKPRSVEVASTKKTTKEQSGPAVLNRYHDVTEDDNGERSQKKFIKTKLPETLPDFIPLD